jgi:hypothetical protein
MAKVPFRYGVLYLSVWSTKVVCHGKSGPCRLSESGLFEPSLKEDRMSRKRTSEQIISKLREAGVALAQGETVGQICCRLGVSEQSYYRWRMEAD